MLEVSIIDERSFKCFIKSLNIESAYVGDYEIVSRINSEDQVERLLEQRKLTIFQIDSMDFIHSYNSILCFTKGDEPVLLAYHTKI